MARFPWTAVAQDIGLLVLRQRKGRFEQVGERPAWHRRLHPGADGTDGDALDVIEQFPFLASFLPDAKALWDGGTDGAVRSDPWVESEWPLQARAIASGKEHVLVIESVAGSFERSADALQEARGQLLDQSRNAAGAARAAKSEAERDALLAAVEGAGAALRVDGDGNVLERLGLDSSDGSVAEVAERAAEAVRTGEQQRISIPGWIGRAVPTRRGDAWAVVFFR